MPERRNIRLAVALDGAAWNCTVYDPADGFILVLRGLDEFVDEVVLPLPERGSFRTEHTSTMLCDDLGPAPARRSRLPEQAVSA